MMTSDFFGTPFDLLQFLKIIIEFLWIILCLFFLS